MVEGNRRARLGVWCAAVGVIGLLVAGLAVPPARGSGERIGVYFDDTASVCTAPLDYFETRTVYICGFPPPDSLVGGALLTLQRPAGLQISAVRLHRDIVFSAIGNVDQVDQVDLRFRACTQSAGPLVMMEVDVWESDASAPRANLTLHLLGAVDTDSLSHDVPQWKICDPGDPEGFLGLVPAVAVDAIFNCTQTCACTTAVATRTWAAVKSLYREH